MNWDKLLSIGVVLIIHIFFIVMIWNPHSATQNMPITPVESVSATIVLEKQPQTLAMTAEPIATEPRLPSKVIKPKPKPKPKVLVNPEPKISREAVQEEILVVPKLVEIEEIKLTNDEPTFGEETNSLINSSNPSLAENNLDLAINLSAESETKAETGTETGTETEMENKSTFEQNGGKLDAQCPQLQPPIYPIEARKNGIETTIIVRFKVKENGKLLRLIGVNYGVIKEKLREPFLQAITSAAENWQCNQGLEEKILEKTFIFKLE